MKRIDATTRQKVIELHKEGKEIKEIPQILNNANSKISYGSVWNIVEASRSQYKATEPSNQVDQSPILTIPDALMRAIYYIEDFCSNNACCGSHGCKAILDRKEACDYILKVNLKLLLEI
ncbi:MAG: hypothetical protein WA364_08070 [Candidatus Nitrosopolaris sp.]